MCRRRISYNMWWPWDKNYNGEYSVGYYNFYEADQVWLD